MANNLGIIPGTTICGLADGAAWPVKNALAKSPRRVRGRHQRLQNPKYAATPAQEYGVGQGQLADPLPANLEWALERLDYVLVFDQIEVEIGETLLGDFSPLESLSLD